MQKLVKHIRDYLVMSQADFAEKLGVNFATMNRNWFVFHTLASEVAIEDLKEIYRHRNEN